MLVFATPNYRSVDPYVAQQRAWRRQLRNQSISNALHAPSQQSIHQFRSINGLLNRVLERDDYLHTQSPHYGYTRNDLAEFEYELALSRAARKAAIQQLQCNYNAGIQDLYAALQAQRMEQEMKHNLRLKCEEERIERELRARRRAAEANSFLANANPSLSAYWPFGLPVDTELPTQAVASTSTAPVQNPPQLQEGLESRMAELQSFLDRLSEGTSTEVPSERVPPTPAAPTSTQVNREAATSSHEGKGKAREIPDCDAEPCVKDGLEARLMDQYQSELSNVFQSILAGLSEGTSIDTPSERVPVTSNAPTSAQVNVDEEATTSSHKGKGKAKETPDSDAEEEPFVSPAQVESSLSQINSIASRLETLVTGFQFPAELDFSPSRSRSPSPAYSALDTDDAFALTYASTNAPLRAHEHALSLLLGDLDNVPSFGSHVVRDARRTVVARVEQALEELEKGVEERRGRARARKTDPVTVTVPVEQSSEPENLSSADLAPIQVPNVSVPALPVEALAPAASSPIEAIAEPDASIEVPADSIEIATAFVAEPSSTSSASLPTTSSEVSETLTAQEVSVPQEEESELPLVDEVSTISVSASEDAVIIEATDVDLTQPSSSSATRPTPLSLDITDSHSENTLDVSFPVSIPDFETLSHADADIPAEVADTTDEPASSAPAAAAMTSSFLGSDHEQTPLEDSDSESYSSVESPASLSPVNEVEADTFLLL
ncbi:hypothetical protein CY34DRAFT_797092 [Suillus luteus UH-Slu-Lm8-n1]|uniref:Unplaced genomic scaffold CY34scaffold_1, whole genome shotgun sequence n=1 Tax=Suillus luteus UH-Slu-Lm8-n1 TaxID=930992 RepID=A0A0D0BVQ9_9AGAM|nr:hypothetical protein CY34DRAFT_797092 [Suillus luteus UH-Slu-Lm8-n1]